MRAKPVRLGLIALSFVLASSASADYVAPSSEPTNSAATNLQAALQAFNRKDMTAAETAVSAALSDPSFAALDESTRHTAVALAAQVMLQAGNPVRAHQFAVQATGMPEQDLDDWRTRLSAALKLQDSREEAECVTAIYRQWGANAAVLRDEAIFHAFRSTDRVELSDVRLDMLQALYQRRWHPADGATASSLWRELTRLLLESKEPDRASEVAVLIDNPDDIIAMRADRRFHSVLKSRFVQSDPRRAARNRIKALEDQVHQQPRSLRTLQYLLAAMLDSRMDAEVLTLTADADRRIQDASSGRPAYDDVARSYSWILDIRARAMRHLGRYDDAVELLRRATQLPDRTDTVSQSINLGSLLCELDRPEESLASLPAPDNVSAYGRMQIESIRLSVALERGNREDATSALAYLREHGADSPSTLQRALLRAGAQDEAEQWLLSRLSDPVQRTTALLELQRFAEPPRPPRAAQWHDLSATLKQQPSVRTAASKLGEIDSYLWHYNTYD